MSSRSWERARRRWLRRSVKVGVAVGAVTGAAVALCSGSAWFAAAGVPVGAVVGLLFWCASPAGFENEDDQRDGAKVGGWLPELRTAVEEGRAGTLRSTR